VCVEDGTTGDEVGPLHGLTSQLGF
jgi:hypothetical protein